MWYLLIPAAVVVGGWLFGARLVLSKAPPLKHDPEPPTPFPGSIPTQFTPGVLPSLPPLPASAEAPSSPSGPGPIVAGDTVMVDIAKAGNLPIEVQGVIPMFVMSLNVDGDSAKEHIMCSFVRPEMMILGPQVVRRAACRKVV